MLAVILMLVLGAALLVTDFINSRKALEGGIVRNSYGVGSRTEELEVREGEGRREKIEVQISERAYSGDELQSMFQRCIVKLDRIILGENKSLDHILQV